MQSAWANEEFLTEKFTKHSALSKVAQILVVLTTFTLFNILSSSQVSAGVQTTLTPQSGNLTNSLNLGVNLDANGESVGTIELTIKPVNLTYVSSTEGSIGCEDTQVLQASGNIVILCSFGESGFTGDGRLVNLVFSTVSGSTSAQVQFLSVDALTNDEESSEIDNNTFVNGNYTVGGGGSNNGGNLPQTSLISWKSAAFILYLMIFGIYIYSTVSRYYGSSATSSKKDKTPLSQKI